MNKSYQEFLGQQKLGDRAMKRRDYLKAIEHYERALSIYNSPGPKQDAVVRALREAKTHVEASAASGMKRPRLVENGLFTPSSVWVRLFTNKQMRETEWSDLASRVFRSMVDSNQRLRTIVSSVDNVVIQKSWEYVPHESGFLHVAMKTAADWVESHIQAEDERWCTTFMQEGTLTPTAASDPALVQMAIFVVIFGSQEIP